MLTLGIDVLGVFLAASRFLLTASFIIFSDILSSTTLGLKPLSSPAFFIASSFDDTAVASSTSGSNAATVRPLNPST